MTNDAPIAHPSTGESLSGQDALEMSDVVAKRRKVEKDPSSRIRQIVFDLLFSRHETSGRLIPPTLLYDEKHKESASFQGTSCGRFLAYLNHVFQSHGLRTSNVSSPRLALSVYKDSLGLSTEGSQADGDNDPAKQHGKDYLAALFGLYPDQDELESVYESSQVKDLYCLLRFCRRLRTVCSTSQVAFREFLKKTEEKATTAARSLLTRRTSSSDDTEGLLTCGGIEARLREIMERAEGSACEHRLRREQLWHEYDRVRIRNSTVSNALLDLFLLEYDASRFPIQSMIFKSSHKSQYERFTIFPFDAALDERVPPDFTFLPSLRFVTRTNGLERIVSGMSASFWSSLLRQGYFAMDQLRSQLISHLEKYFLSGLVKDIHAPIQLDAHFSPTYPMSFYLYGVAGSGKSSLTRYFPIALNDAIHDYADPEVSVRYVKENLNKPIETLQLEFDLRPNNNDLSIMSIIQGRRMALSQLKPGLVVVALEEMPPHDLNIDPNQLETSRLLSQRFSGRIGQFQDSSAAVPRNATIRGMSRDASIVPLFSSNYELHESSCDALTRLDMFRNIQAIKMEPVGGVMRATFANAFLEQCIYEAMGNKCNMIGRLQIKLDILLGDGDTRPLVRHLRMLSFYSKFLIEKRYIHDGNVSPCPVLSIKESGTSCLVKLGREEIVLSIDRMNNLRPLQTRTFDPRTAPPVDLLRKDDIDIDFDELATIVDFWLAGTLTPAVVVATNPRTSKSIAKAVASIEGVNFIRNVDAGSYKMMKSLYDPKGTPNLRDDILRFGRGSLVVIELICPNFDSQLRAREIVEDSPSMTAFSTQASALSKSGLFFSLCVKGSISPEIASRSSLIFYGR